jgi:hypothetical protein
MIDVNKRQFFNSAHDCERNGQIKIINSRFYFIKFIIYEWPLTKILKLRTFLMQLMTYIEHMKKKRRKWGGYLKFIIISIFLVCVRSKKSMWRPFQKVYINIKQQKQQQWNACLPDWLTVFAHFAAHSFQSHFVADWKFSNWHSLTHSLTNSFMNW